MSSILNFIKSTFKAWGIPVTQYKKVISGPNTLAELLEQFDLPLKEKTQNDIVRDYQVFITMANLEVEMLRMEPSKAFRGLQIWLDNNGNKFIDWVPCIVRPEVVYCSYGKN